jgi:hypothetical protein
MQTSEAAQKIAEAYPRPELVRQIGHTLDTVRDILLQHDHEDTVTLLVDNVAEEHLGVHQPDHIVDSFGPELFGYTQLESGKYQHTDDEQEYDQVSDDPHAWEAIDAVFEEASNILNDRLGLQGISIGFGNSDHGDFGLLAYIDPEILDEDQEALAATDYYVGFELGELGMSLEALRIYCRRLPGELVSLTNEGGQLLVDLKGPIPKLRQALRSIEMDLDPEIEPDQIIRTAVDAAQVEKDVDYQVGAEAKAQGKITVRHGETGVEMEQGPAGLVGKWFMLAARYVAQFEKMLGAKVSFQINENDEAVDLEFADASRPARNQHTGNPLHDMVKDIYQERENQWNQQMLDSKKVQSAKRKYVITDWAGNVLDHTGKHFGPKHSTVPLEFDNQGDAFEYLDVHYTEEERGDLEAVEAAYSDLRVNRTDEALVLQWSAKDSTPADVEDEFSEWMSHHGWDWVQETGLNEAPVVGPVDNDEIYYYDRYQVDDWRARLLEDGEVKFTRHQD